MNHYYAVIGRIPGDDEDTCLFYEGENLTTDDLTNLFVAEMYAATECSTEAVIKTWGDVIYVTQILQSTNPMQRLL